MSYSNSPAQANRELRVSSPVAAGVFHTSWKALILLRAEK
jgi:hypothetical protein